MNARLQYTLGAADLQVLLALLRAGNLADTAERLGVDASTVFRTLQRVERGLGQRLFERTRAGYRPTELAQTLGEHAEAVESALESARSAVQQRPDEVTGRVRITTTDTLLHGLVAPVLPGLRARHPRLELDLAAGNELASLTRHDADIAVRATRRPPPHLVGRHLGPLRVAVFAAARGRGARSAAPDLAAAAWIAPDDALPEHPSVLWRKRHLPRVSPVIRVNSILTVAELVALGLGVGILPLFLAARRTDLRQISDTLDDAQSELWLLTHAESRHVRRIAAVYGDLGEALKLA